MQEMKTQIELLEMLRNELVNRECLVNSLTKKYNGLCQVNSVLRYNRKTSSADYYRIESFIKEMRPKESKGVYFFRAGVLGLRVGVINKRIRELKGLTVDGIKFDYLVEKN